MRILLILTAFILMPFAALADDAAPPPAQADASQTPKDVKLIPMKPIPGDQKKFNAALAAYDAKDYETAYKLFSELADDYDLGAMRNVALMRRDGLGTKQDPEGAQDMMKDAADRGLPTAQYDLGVMLLDGAAGDPNPDEALLYLESAAQAGHPLAQYRLAQLYEAGDVVPKDMGVAEVLYAEAAKHGVQPALDHLKKLKGWTKTPPELMPQADSPPRRLSKP